MDTDNSVVIAGLGEGVEDMEGLSKKREIIHGKGQQCVDFKREKWVEVE